MNITVEFVSENGGISIIINDMSMMGMYNHDGVCSCDKFILKMWGNLSDCFTSNGFDYKLINGYNRLVICGVDEV